MASTSSPQKFHDQEYRHAYAESYLDTVIATQIRVLREQRGWTQKRLAECVGMGQSRISALEDANYSRWSIGTLKRLAKAFDLRLSVKFETFSSLLRETTDISRASLERPGFTDDVAFGGGGATETIISGASKVIQNVDATRFGINRVKAA